MRIGINITSYVGEAVGGLGIYLQEILTHFPRVSEKSDKIFCFIHKDVFLRFKKIQNYRGINFVIIKSTLDSKEIKTELLSLIFKHRLDVWFCPLLVLDPPDIQIPSAVLIPDMQHEHFTEFFPKSLLNWRRKEYKESANNADIIFTLSEYSKKDILKYLNVDSEKVIVTYLDAPSWTECSANIERDSKILEHYGLEHDKYLFYPANCWPHKNHTLLLKASRKIFAKYPSLKLVFTGYKDKNAIEIEKTALKYGLRDNVKHLGYIDNNNVANLYRNALLLVFPSLFEGFGLPLVEAMRLNCPIVCSNSAHGFDKWQSETLKQ